MTIYDSRRVTQNKLLFLFTMSASNTVWLIVVLLIVPGQQCISMALRDKLYQEFWLHRLVLFFSLGLLTIKTNAEYLQTYPSTYIVCPVNNTDTVKWKLRSQKQ